MMDLRPGERCVSLELSETEWASVVAGLYLLENQSRRLAKEEQARNIHRFRRALHRRLGEDLVDARGGGANEYTYGFPGDEP